MEAMKKTLNGIFISTMKKQSLNRGLKNRLSDKLCTCFRHHKDGTLSTKLQKKLPLVVFSLSENLKLVLGGYKPNLRFNKVKSIKNGFDINKLLVIRRLKISDLFLYVWGLFDFIIY